MRSSMEAAEKSEKGTDLFRDVTGGTRNSIHIETYGLKGAVIAGGASVFLENGTKAHEIRARNASVLRFYVNGQAVFRRSVRHPGTAPRPFVAQARQRAIIAAEFAGEVFADYAIRKFNAG